MKIGAYDVEDTIGEGGMGVVLRARGPAGSTFAVKVLRPEARPDNVARFEREIRLLASLGDSEGFVPLVDSGDHDGRPFLVMPLLAGGTLRDRLDRGPMPPADAIALAAALAAAMARAHERELVHRDLKPENILFTEDGRPLIADLGIAKHVSGSGGAASAHFSQTGHVRGTAGYMAPEQMEDSKRAGPPADVFALGAILHECLAGEPAFPGATLIEVMTRASEGKRARLDAIAPGTPAWVVPVVDRALATELAARFADAGAFLRALEAAESGARTRARRSRTRRVLLALLLGAVPAAGGGALVLRRARPSSAPPPAPRPPPTPATPPARPPAPSGALDARARAHAHAERAYAAIRKFHTEEAREQAAAALALDPNDALALAVRSSLRHRDNDKRGALEDARRSLALDDELAFAWVVLAGAAMSTPGLTDEVIPAATRAIELDPKLEMAWTLRGGAKSNKGDPTALDDLNRAIELAPYQGAAYFFRAQYHDKVKRYELAEADWTKVIALDQNDNFVAFTTRGYDRVRLNQWDAALEDFSAVIAQQPNKAVGYMSRAMVYTYKKLWREALADADKALELDPTVKPALRYRAQARANLGQREAAIKDYEAYLADPGADPDVTRVRGELEELERAPQAK